MASWVYVCSKDHLYRRGSWMDEPVFSFHHFFFFLFPLLLVFVFLPQPPAPPTAASPTPHPNSHLPRVHMLATPLPPGESCDWLRMKGEGQGAWPAVTPLFYGGHPESRRRRSPIPLGPSRPLPSSHPPSFFLSQLPPSDRVREGSGGRGRARVVLAVPPPPAPTTHNVAGHNKFG